jgi:hypothetical protein
MPSVNPKKPNTRTKHTTSTTHLLLRDSKPFSPGTCARCAGHKCPG